MPLFRTRKVSKDEAQRRLEQRLVVAKESPEETFDLSGCGITELPQDVFSLCRVFRKQVLLLNDNDLSSFKGGGSLKDLIDVRILVASNNRLTSLPSDLGELKSLQVLNVERNKLKSLPKSIGSLSCLQTLKVKGNNLQSLPDEIGNLKLLKTLDVSDNPKLDALPASMAYCRLLETITLDVDRVSVPPRDVSRQGNVAILKYLSQCAGIEYFPSSKEVLNEMNAAAGHPVKSKEIEADPVDKLVAAAMSRHTAEQDEKRQQMMRLEKQMRDLDAEQAALASKASRSHDDLVDQIRKAEEEMDSNIHWEQYKQEARKYNMSSALAADEQLNTDTVAMILQINERSKEHEAILDQLELERIQTDELVKVTQEEEERLRKEEVLASMAIMLENRRNQDRIIQEYESSKSRAMKEAMQSEIEANSQVQDTLNEQYQDRDMLKRQISTQEHSQMQAIQALLIQRDTKHRRLTDQIGMLQDELAQLTMLELDKRDERQDAENIALAAKREGIVNLMSQLVDEQQKREQQLMQRLIEMEEKRVSDVEDYWLIQYQRLLDNKPQSLLEKECDTAIAKVLVEAGAQQYTALFARHRISWKMLTTMSAEELKEMGIRELGVRRAIMEAVEERVAIDDKAKLKEKELQQEEPQEIHPQPSAPSLSDTATPMLQNNAAYPECIICMDNRSNIVLLPCGHVCCCFRCSSAIAACPICRQTISQRVQMFFS